MGIVFMAVMAYIGTNIDDIFITTLLYTAAADSRRRKAVVAGRYMGIFVLFAVSALGAKGVRSAAGQYAHLLGIVPLIMGINAAREQLKHKNSDENDTETVTAGRSMVLTTALMAIASGGDNIGVYIPMMAGMTPAEMAVTAIVFTVMTAVWCALAAGLADMPPLKKALERYRGVIVPAVYILLGVYILAG